MADPTGQSHSRGYDQRRTLAYFLLGAMALIAVPLLASRVVGQPEGRRYTFEIPSGASERIAAGEVVEIIPTDLDLRLNDRLVLINNDERTHQVGVFQIRPGETIDRQFSEAASLSGFCSLHSDSRISIDVR